MRENKLKSNHNTYTYVRVKFLPSEGNQPNLCSGDSKVKLITASSPTLMCSTSNRVTVIIITYIFYTKTPLFITHRYLQKGLTQRNYPHMSTIYAFHPSLSIQNTEK
jgi:hypothetical protein